MRGNGTCAAEVCTLGTVHLCSGAWKGVDPYASELFAMGHERALANVLLNYTHLYSGTCKGIDTCASDLCTGGGH